jgi:hypothetical protein
MLMSGVNIAFPTDSKNRGEIARASVGKYVVASWEKLDLSEAHSAVDVRVETCDFPERGEGRKPRQERAAQIWGIWHPPLRRECE